MIEKDGKGCGVILSGGKSRRMAGKDKAFLKMGNKALIERVIENFDKQVDILAINTNATDQSYHNYGLPVLKDVVSGYLGPLAGLLTSMSWAEEKGYENVVTVAVDTPFFPTNFVNTMKEEMIKSQAKIVLAQSLSGEKKYSTQIVARDMQMLGSRNNSETQSNSSEESSMDQTPMDDEIPF